MHLEADDTLVVERDAGVRETLHRVTPEGRLPVDLPGRYHNADVAATWTVSATETGAVVHIEGPLRVGDAWSIEPVEGDFIRVHPPAGPFPAWLDGHVLRDAAGRITALRIDGGRVKGLIFERDSQ
jgi:hypothetical protein